MSTLVCFHAHPDDEAIATGGLMAKAAAAGHRVFLVCATRGECGEPEPGVLRAGEQLWERRMAELEQASEILGAEKPLWLGYEDSGMVGEESNSNPASFWQSDHDEASARLAGILTEVQADVLTIYDEHGGYGHPDHIRVHTVGKAAAALGGVENVFEATFNRDHFRELIAAQQELAAASGEEAEDPGIDVETSGTPSAGIAYRVDVGSTIAQKRAAMAAHRSQIGPESFFFTMPVEFFGLAFGSEWFNIPGVSTGNGPTDVELLPGLD